MREESSVSNGLTDQRTDDLLDYYKEIYTGLSQKNRSEYGRNSSGIITSTTDNFTTLYCPAQHDVQSDAKFIIINIFSFYPFHILTWSSFAICNVFAHIAMVLSV